MELINKLKSIFNVETSLELKKNRDYGFSINWIKATKENPHHIIFTSGLSDSKQSVSEKYPEFEHVELYICLPEYWKVTDRNDENQWPIEWLNRIAQVPQKNSTWFGPGDTIPTGRIPEPISNKFQQEFFILTEPILLESQLKEVELPKKTIRFLAVVPIFENEFDFKTSNSAKKLFNKFQLKNTTEEIDEYRTTVVKKTKIWKYAFAVGIIGILIKIILMIIKMSK